MGITKQMQLEEMDECQYECPLCADVIHCDKDTFEHLSYQGHCDHCEHVWTKDD